MLSSSVHPMTDYYVLTTDGRTMRLPGFDKEHMLRRLHFDGHSASVVLLWSEYEEAMEAVRQADAKARLDKRNLLNKVKEVRARRARRASNE